MCRADVAEAAETTLARLMAAIRDALCAQTGADPETVLIGPIDFGEVAMAQPPVDEQPDDGKYQRPYPDHRCPACLILVGECTCRWECGTITCRGKRMF